MGSRREFSVPPRRDDRSRQWKPDAAPRSKILLTQIGSAVPPAHQTANATATTLTRILTIALSCCRISSHSCSSVESFCPGILCPPFDAPRRVSSNGLCRTSCEGSMASYSFCCCSSSILRSASMSAGDLNVWRRSKGQSIIPMHPIIASSTSYSPVPASV